MRTLPLLVTAFVIGCEPKLSSDDWLITSARVIAVRGEPPETKAGASATFTAFIAAPGNASPSVLPSFGFCTAPKPPSENGVVSPGCLDGAALVPVGSGDTVTAKLPATACTLFGPVAAPGGFRPRDPDLTGGYYQPLRVDLDGAVPVFHLARIACGVENASNDIATEFAGTYVLNQNPVIAALDITVDGRPVSPGAPMVPEGAHVGLTVRWTAGDAERYVYFDPRTLTLTSAREAMKVAWYVDAGTLQTESTSRGPEDETLAVSNEWIAPTNAGSFHLWVVLRDSRGGAAVHAQDLTVTR